MTSPAEQPTLDLGDYRGKAITDTAVKLANESDGFHPQTAMSEPRIFEMDEEFTIAVRVRVTGHGVSRVVAKKDGEEDRLSLIQTWKAQTIAIIPDTGATKKELDRVAAAERARAEAAKAAKSKKRTPVKRGQLKSVGSSIEDALQDGGSADETPPPESE